MGLRDRILPELSMESATHSQETSVALNSHLGPHATGHKNPQTLTHQGLGGVASVTVHKDAGSSLWSLQAVKQVYKCLSLL